MAEKQQWMTNFYYGQELRSRYMNGALNSGFRPGIYNGSMALYTHAGSDEKVPGLYLFIKKGTTFIFSNSYSVDTDGRLYRDLNGINNKYETLIKSVALDDYNTCLIPTSTGTSISKAAITVFGTNNAPAKRFYIVASMLYSPFPSDNPENAAGSGTPHFEVALDNPKFRTGDNGIPSGDDSENFYFAMADDIDGSNESSPRIPDGSTNTENAEFNKYSYLMLGTVIDMEMLDGYTRRGYLGSDGQWAQIPNMDSGDIQWMKNHVFTGRGLPDYRQNLLDTKEIESPDFILNDNLNEIYVDLKNIYVDDICFSSTIDWRDVRNIGNRSVSDGLKNREHMYKLDHLVKKAPGTPVGQDDEYIDYEPEANNIIKELNSKKVKFDLNDRADEFCLLSDAIFVSTRHEYSSAPKDSIKNIFKKYSPNDKSSDNPSIRRNYYLYNRTPKIVPFQWVSNCSFANLDPFMDIEGSVGARITNNFYGPDLLGIKIIPLDIGNANSDRLSSLIINRNIIPLLIDHMRQNENESPYLNPMEASSLVPIAIGFRKLRVVRGNPDETGFSPIERLVPVDSISKIAENDSHPRAGRINPANIYSFLDFQFKTNQSNSVDFAVDDAFTVIPVMN